ncbi:MAG: hypothetical protein P8M02_03470 [Flavobacteriaceae bacterium]|nr:hypothetical protein [Flavobacteriaceae bacterium]MDG2386456.1 hypothetical protein [Flavobacteriaceae bacterium]
MILRFRIILDVKEDVLRDIEIEDSATFEDLHHAITQAFGFLGNEMASFYRSDEDWIQGEELPLEAMDPSQESCRDQVLNTVISASQHQLIYVYDFLNLWTFFVELMEVGEQITGTTYPNLIHAQGEVPEEAPEKLFQSEDTLNPAEASEFDEDDSEEYDESSFY